MRRKWVIRVILFLLITALVAVGYYAWFAFPIISGYNAKVLCSSVFVEGRKEKEVRTMDLSGFFLSLGSTQVNWKDSSVTASVLGLARRKAIYRHGLGCTLVNELKEEEIRSQQFNTMPPENTDSMFWPAGNRMLDTVTAGLNRDKLNKVLDHIFLNRPEKEQTRAVVVLYKGQLVAERYAEGFDQHSLMRGWSVAKSITGALAGIQVQQKKIGLDLPVPVPEWKNAEDPRHGITLRHLLQQTSGLDFREKYDGFSNVTEMLFSKGDMAAYTASLPLKHPPGTVFNYSSGNSNIISRIIRHTIGEQEYASFPRKALFSKIGMNTAILEPDASGTFIGSSYIYATARDYARFGLLYYNNGIWNGERILPEDWVKQTITPPTANKNKNYGFQFWLNGYVKEDRSRRWYPDLPPDMFFADGYGGQDIYIIPSKGLVVVRLGLNVIDENLFLKKIIEAIN